MMVKPKPPNDERDQKRQKRAANERADERPIKNLVDRRSGREDEKSARQREIKHETVKGGGRFRPQCPVRMMPKTGRTTLMRASMGRTSWVSQQSSTHITEPERQKAIVRFGS
jgi:hypothetical protein